MVDSRAIVDLAFAAVTLQETAQPALEWLAPPKRAAVVMALLALVLIGVTLVACVMIGARWVRQLARQNPAARLNSAPEFDRNRAVRATLTIVLPTVESGTTLHLDHSSAETKVD